MFALIRANTIESLVAILGDRLRKSPLASPFSPEIVLVPSPLMRRWLNLQLAQRHGIAANLLYPLPATFIWDLARRILDPALPESDPLDRESMAWRLFALLPELLPAPEFTPLQRYLAKDDQGLQRWQLAVRIAQVFDRYQFHRPQTIRAWDRGEESHWQALLWRRLTEALTAPHRVLLMDRLIRALGRGEGAPPERVSLFTLSSVPPLFLDAIQALAARSQVDFYLSTPTPEYWADLVSQKEKARRRLEQPETAELWEVAHPLVASWGRPGQALQDLLLEREMPQEEIDGFEEPSGHSLLSLVQRDIYRLAPRSPREPQAVVSPKDRSIQVHRCHSPLRECQVLRDTLLGLLEADPTLVPEAILVMVPKISEYAPFIEAVFQQDENQPNQFLPWNLSDTSTLEEAPLIQVFLRLLTLPTSRLHQSEVLSYLEIPTLAARFGLEDQEIAQIRAWLEETQVRWGWDGAHKGRFGLPEIQENTWTHAGQRLFAGYALGEGRTALGSIAPIPGIEGSDAQTLGKFWQFVSALEEAGRWLAEPRSARAWQRTIARLLQTFFSEDPEEADPLQGIRDATAELAEVSEGMEAPLSPVLVHRWFQERLAQERHPNRAFRGGVTFCSLRPGRRVPARVICLLGLQEDAFPRRDQPVDFDRMANRWRPGDPHLGFSDRYLFLEVLLCARQTLYLSYLGLDIHTNHPKPPSILVAELLDYLDHRVRPAGSEAPISQVITTDHPLQPFSIQNFSGPQASYDRHWLQVARALYGPRDHPPPPGPRKPSEACEVEARRGLDLRVLERFVRHPIRYFIQKRLGIYFPRESPSDPDEEPFFLDAFQGYEVKRRLVAGYLQGRPPAQAELSAQGALPHGSLARLAYEAQREQVSGLFRRLQAFVGRRVRPVPIDCTIDGRRYRGRIQLYDADFGLIHWRPGKLRGEDLLSLWIQYLAWCAQGGSREKRAVLHGTDESLYFSDPPTPREAGAMLVRYHRWYEKGMGRPLTLLPRASYAYARALREEEDAERARKAAYSEWRGQSFRKLPGDRDDAYVALAFRDAETEPLDTREFRALALEFFERMLCAGTWSDG